ncbi:MAG: AraC family transcriptional regulator [Rhodobacteraceae bacterium]|nr:MAG: AraC family transcriptional regulator [Paracoccaceae bacterium]
MQSITEFAHLSQIHWPVQDMEVWTDKLQTICGQFNPVRKDSNQVRGGVQVHEAGGLALTQVANDVDFVRREWADIRIDSSDHLLLFIQLEGECGIEQHGQDSIITAGDCILTDSSCPSTFHYGGKFSNHLSIQLPRPMVFCDRKTKVEISHRLSAQDPMASILHGLVARLLSTKVSDYRAPQLCDLLLSTTRHAFSGAQALENPISKGAETRLEMVQILIDQHLTEEYLSPKWLAAQMGVSLRTLQADFSTLDTTATELIRIGRLRLVHNQLQQMNNRGPMLTIAEVAYAAGFNDISYFNRSFRKFFGCSPKDVLHQAHGSLRVD